MTLALTQAADGKGERFEAVRLHGAEHPFFPLPLLPFPVAAPAKATGTKLSRHHPLSQAVGNQDDFYGTFGE